MEFPHRPKTVALSRWRKAQDYERSYWENEAARIRAQQLAPPDAWYRWKAGKMADLLDPVFSAEQKRAARVLEIGCGPVGIVSCLDWGERHALDPLDDFYGSQEVFSRYRDPAVHFQKGMGEQLPFEDAGFDLVILENVLDHVQDAGRMLREASRVLRPAGLLYFTLNVHTPWGAALHSLLSVLLIDPGHPYSFTAAGIRSFLNTHGFLILRENLDDYRRTRELDRRSASIRDRIKGYAGLSEFVLYALCAKAQGAPEQSRRWT